MLAKSTLDLGLQGFLMLDILDSDTVFSCAQLVWNDANVNLTPKFFNEQFILMSWYVTKLWKSNKLKFVIASKIEILPF